MIDTLTRTHANTVRYTIREMVQHLVSHLGPTAVSLLANAKDSKQSSKWAKADGPEPRREAARRIIAAHRAWNLIAQSDNEHTARNWFIAGNPRLDELSPLEALRDGDDAAVLAAAIAFASGADD